MTIKKVAESAGVTVETVRRWDREGKLKSQGRSLRGWRYYLFTDVQQLLKDHLCCTSESPVEIMDEGVHELCVARELYLALQRGDTQTAVERCRTLQHLLSAAE
ncbi:MerR family transcriptional regulator [Acidithiobacillus thiooxidans]|uniref:MerR family DNA-binding transcriptional regulator n=1 Tax=Acidithiobacillus thiooxidans TaxID=930 RepID=UPI001C06F102|nr:MerR family DNA-binding transcriptional regulator [Acidithiobacillus thiooxidans]MBU2837962.1 MerR family transcriptional regulator [Acidithiobacillus thiooxidans]